VIDRVVTLDGDLDAEQRQRLLEIADRCPVHKTLVGDITNQHDAGGRMNKEIIKRYSNGEITVVWQPSLCVHSGICARRPAEGLRFRGGGRG
jgi:hypothetical protein